MPWSKSPAGRAAKQAYQLKWQRLNCEKVREYTNRYRHRNLEMVRKRDAENHRSPAYRERLRLRLNDPLEREKRNRKLREYRANHNERINGYYKNEKSRLARLAAGKRWADRNKTKLAAKARRRRGTPRGLIESRLRARFRVLVNLGKAVKVGTCEKLCGCSYEELIGHISAQFQPGMNWGSRPEWHIDHIIPCAAFDLLRIEGQKACFHFTNLRPLWAQENRRKSDKIIPFVSQNENDQSPKIASSVG